MISFSEKPSCNLPFARLKVLNEKRGQIYFLGTTYRRKAGSKHHVISDAQGLSFTTILPAANTHDVIQLEPLIEGMIQDRIGE